MREFWELKSGTAEEVHPIIVKSVQIRMWIHENVDHLTEIVKVKALNPLKTPMFGWFCTLFLNSRFYSLTPTSIRLSIMRRKE